MSKEVSASGFVAGTLVHTDKGLVPIEQLKIGDLVLSRPENDPNAPNEYKRVINTFKSAEKQKIIRVVYLNGHDSTSDELYVYCTEDHPFWTEEYGWMKAIDLAGHTKSTLEKQCTLIGYDNKRLFGAEYTLATPLKRTTIPDVAIQTNDDYESLFCHESQIYSIIDFRSGKPVLIEVGDSILFWDFGYEIIKYWSDKQEHIKLAEASEEFRFAFSKEGNFYVGGDAFCYETGYFKSYGEPKDGYYDGWTAEQIRADYQNTLDSECYEKTVYNIEVANFHTYFVGADGVWINNTNTCLNVGVFPSSPKV